MNLAGLAALAQEPELALEVIDSYGQACLADAGDTPLPAPREECEDAVPGLAARLVSEERRTAVEAKLPWIEYARREFRALTAGRIQAR